MSDNNLYVHHHLGLGDCIDCNAMVRIFLDEYDFESVHVFCKKRYFNMVEHMYRDDENIHVIEVPNEDEYATIKKFVETNNIKNFLKVGHDFYPWGQEKQLNMGCAEIFYKLVNLDPERRFDDFYYEREESEEDRVLAKLNPENKEFVFVHDDPARGFEISDEKIKEMCGSVHIIRNDITENIFHFCKLLEKAKEIHLMESAFKSLVEVLDTTDKIFFHNFREGASSFLGNTRKTWNEVKYE